MEASAQAAEAAHTCPECGSVVAVDLGFSPWCDRCDWNVVRGEAPASRRLLGRFFKELGQRSGAGLARQMISRPSYRGRVTAAVVIAGTIALIVHGLTLLVLLGALLLVTLPEAHVVAIAAGLFLLLVAWVLRPQTMPPPAGVLPRAEFPGLYGLADKVAEAVGTPPVDGIVVEPSYNASFARYGWRRRRIVTLGLPLVAVLAAQERVFLMGHELAHGRSGDSTRGFFIGGAIDTLQRWYDLFRPRRLAPSEWGIEGLAALPAHLFMLVLSMAPLSVSYVMAVLLYRDSQRAEYRADLMAAEVSGTTAAVQQMDKAHLGGTFYNIASGLFVNERKDVFGEFAQAVETMPPRELERIRRMQRITSSSLDATHPPTAHRIEVLRAHPQTARVVLSASDSARIDQELDRLKPAVRQALLEEVHEQMDPGVDMVHADVEVGWY